MLKRKHKKTRQSKPGFLSELESIKPAADDLFKLQIHILYYLL